MLVERSLDPGYLSNAYVVGDREGGTAVFVDSGAPIEPLLAFVREHGLTPTHVLRTHSHADHVTHEGELGLPVVTGALSTGGLLIEAIPTPGHSDDMVSSSSTTARARRSSSPATRSSRTRSAAATSTS